LKLATDRFRKRRMRDFIAEFRPAAETRILDVGGTGTNWMFVPVQSEIVLLNVVAQSVEDVLSPNMRWVQGDGCDLQWGDDAFDICFSNSTIEHLHTYENQRRFAAEVRRVARSYYVQTPARSFPLEPHWLGLFIHWLPRRWQIEVARWGTLYGLVAKPSRAQVEALVDEYRLLSRREMEELFPDADVRRERFMLMTKSYVAVRRP
jgi:hypothetical protein